MQHKTLLKIGLVLIITVCYFLRKLKTICLGLQAIMSSRTPIEVFGHIAFSFTHYHPQEPEYTAESFGYDPLQITGREWYYHPPEDELIKNTATEKLQAWTIYRLTAQI